MGGTVDPKSGEVIWEFKVPLDEQRTHYGKHAPTALVGLSCTPIDLPGFAFDGHGEPVNAVFSVACRCGGGRFIPVASGTDEEDYEPIVTLECVGCGAERRVFDSRKHGYDAAPFGESDDAAAPDEQPEGLLGDSLGDPPYGIIVRLEYPSDMLGDKTWKAQEHELFSWITIVGKSAKGQLATLFEMECA